MTTLTTPVSGLRIWLITVLYAAVVVGGVLFPFVAVAAYAVLG